jgi:protoheme IX farnesyltransferase
LEAWVLFAIVFLWQLPHFLALAWVYRDDYARAGLKMLSVTDDGESTFRQAVLYAVAMLPVTLAPSVLGLAGPWYFFGALGLTVWLIATALSAARNRSIPHARRLFMATVLWLPAVLALMVLDKTI